MTIAVLRVLCGGLPFAVTADPLLDALHNRVSFSPWLNAAHNPVPLATSRASGTRTSFDVLTRYL